MQMQPLSSVLSMKDSINSIFRTKIIVARITEHFQRSHRYFKNDISLNL